MGLYSVINRALLQGGQPEDITQVLANLDGIAAILNGGIDPVNLRGAPALVGGEAPVWDGTKFVAQQGRAFYGVNPPGSPRDGDEWVFPADATAGVLWRFRYNAASASAYKWEFVGGAPAYAVVDTQETTATTGTWLDLATLGPRVVLPRDGDYDAIANTFVMHSAVGGDIYAGVANSATVSPGPANANFLASSVNGRAVIVSRYRFIGLAAASDIRLRYYMANGGTASWAHRHLTVWPVRVA